METINIYQAYKEQVKAAVTGSFKSSKKVSVANVIIAGNRILLLKRANTDDFHGGTWCLPGGGVDMGEAPVTACIRETYEECALTPAHFELATTWIVDLPTITIHYYCSYLKSAIGMCEIVLDWKEHQNYQWCTTAQWMQMDLILDLKQHLLGAMVQPAE